MDVWACGCVGVLVCGCVGVWVCGCVGVVWELAEDQLLDIKVLCTLCE